MSIEPGNIPDPHDHDEPDYEPTCDDCGDELPCKCDIADWLRDEEQDV